MRWSRGLAVELTAPSSVEWTTHVRFDRAPGGRYLRSESSTANDGSGVAAPGPRTTVDGDALERAIDGDPDALVVVLGADRDGAR